MIFENKKKLICSFTGKTEGNVDFRFDEEEGTLTNRKKIVKKLGFTLDNLYEMEQIHGSTVSIVNSKSPHLSPTTDSLVTNISNNFLMVKTADCFPVVFYDPVAKVVAAAHLGWRGAVEKIFLETILVLMRNFSCRTKDLLVGIGPGARKCCFDHKNFVQEKLPEWQMYIKSNKTNKTLDIPSFIIDKLVTHGVKKENIEDCGICTVCNQNYFSHFRSLQKKDPEGRSAAIIGMTNN